MAAWSKDMAALPFGVPVLLRLIDAPIGWATPDATSHRATVILGQRGDHDNGVWTQNGFFADRPAKGSIGSDVFCAWAHVPPYDVEGAE